ncbi:MAG: hypothetical protein WCT04_01605 [Planctomycetota bacterium]
MRNLIVPTLLVIASFSLACFTLAGEAPSSADLVKEGRKHFEQAHYTAALDAFEKAIATGTAKRETQLLAAAAAYWARQPKRAMEFLNTLNDKTQLGGNDEWNICLCRIMTLHALGQLEAADLCVERMRDIRSAGKSKLAREAKGFVRENIFGKNMRAAIWEAFDERGDAPTAWTIIVTRRDDAPVTPAKPGERQDPPAEKKIATLAVEVTALPAGGTGFAFTEETDEARRVYKYWTARPTYAEACALVLAVLGGTAEPLEEKLHKPPLITVVGLDEDDAMSQEIRDMKLNAEAENIVVTAWKLRKVQADITKLARILPTDKAALETYMRDFETTYPRASATAGELSEIVSNAKAANVKIACEKLAKLSTRSPYLEFALLTALNTRDRDIPAATMMAFAQSRDAVVRQTTALMLARRGQKHGLELLLADLNTADPRGCELIAGKLDDVLGHVFDTPPNSSAADVEKKSAAWKSSVLDWQKANWDKLEFNATPVVGEGYWTIKK